MAERRHKQPRAPRPKAAIRARLLSGKDLLAESDPLRTFQAYETVGPKRLAASMHSSGYTFLLVWAAVAATILVYWYFLWRMARRWNLLLRRAGMTPDDDVLRKTTKIVGFSLSSQYKSFEDRKLSQLVLYTRWSFFIAFIGIIVWVVYVGVS
jgi:hypothetical protein